MKQNSFFHKSAALVLALCLTVSLVSGAALASELDTGVGETTSVELQAPADTGAPAEPEAPEASEAPADPEVPAVPADPDMPVDPGMSVDPEANADPEEPAAGSEEDALTEEPVMLDLAAAQPAEEELTEDFLTRFVQEYGGLTNDAKDEILSLLRKGAYTAEQKALLLEGQGVFDEKDDIRKDTMRRVAKVLNDLLWENAVEYWTMSGQGTGAISGVVVTNGTE